MVPPSKPSGIYLVFFIFFSKIDSEYDKSKDSILVTLLAFKGM